MHIQLSEPMQDVNLAYMFVPGHGFVRADLLDDLPEDQFDALNAAQDQYMNEVFDDGGMGFWIFSKKGRERMKQRKDDRHQRKMAKKDSKTALRNAKAEGKVDTFGSSIGKGIKNIFGGKSEEALPPAVGPEDSAQQRIRIQAEYDDNQKKWYQEPVVIVGGVVVLGGLIYLATRN